MADLIERPQPKAPVPKPGFLQAAALHLLTRAAVIETAVDLSPRFRLITLAGRALQGVAWAPGQKLQIQMRGLTFRTYTPVMWDGVAGQTRVVAYRHGEGRGAAWATAAEAGDTVLLFGPRRSLDFAGLERPALFVGDETSIGPAAALLETAQGADEVRFVFEATSAAESAAVLGKLGVHGAELVERQAGDAHHAALEAAAVAAFEADRQQAVVLSGKAATIQRLSRALKARGAVSGQIKAKAYWAPGKQGLD